MRGDELVELQSGDAKHGRVHIPSICLLGLASGLSSFGVTIVIPVLMAISTQFVQISCLMAFGQSAFRIGSTPYPATGKF
jgi:hypothetical protein